MPSRRGPTDGAAHEAAIDFEYDDERFARRVGESVRVEVGEIADDRSRADVTRDGRTVHVAVSAADLVALRAGVNTWIRLVQVAEDVAQAGASAGAGKPDDGDGGDRSEVS
ncbi:KEOPS complex Pcc1-like subunit [Halobellus sp. Atlit-31R]|nr:KEOPS complex Pcc1-like subunit [Halobellus sp. Atlit-31R]